MASQTICISATASSAQDRGSRRDAVGRMNYLKHLEIYKLVPPFKVAQPDLDPDFPPSNLVFEQGPEEAVEDIRGREDQFDLDNNAFCIRRNEFKPVGFDDTEEVKKSFSPQIVDLIKREIPDAEFIHILNWVVRTADPKAVTNPMGAISRSEDMGPKIKPTSPYFQVHNDCSHTCGLKRFVPMLEALGKADAANKRIRLINVWRPIDHPVGDCHLALCDGSTFDEERCQEGIGVIPGNYVCDVLYPGYSEKQKWYYMSHQRPDEVWLFKQFDSRPAGPALCCPHSAFWEKSPDECTHPRKSIEVRALVISP